MNRKVKVAYAHIIIGFVLFLIGLGMMLSHTLNKNESANNDQKGNEIRKIVSIADLNSAAGDIAASKQLRLAAGVDTKSGGSLIQFNMSSSSLSSDKKARSKLEYDQAEEEDFIKRYCEMRRQRNAGDGGSLILSLRGLFGGQSGQREARSSDSSSSTSNNKSPTILNNIFSFLMCSTDGIYLIMVVCLTVFGSLVLVYGCVRIYESDVKLINETNNTNSSSNNQNVDDSMFSGRNSRISDTFVDKKRTNEKTTSLCNLIRYCLNMKPAAQQQSTKSTNSTIITRCFRRHSRCRKDSPDTVIYDEIKSMDQILATNYNNKNKKKKSSFTLPSPRIFFASRNDHETQDEVGNGSIVGDSLLPNTKNLNEPAPPSNELEIMMQKRRLAAAERMCPFIYDELPAFILEKKSDLMFDCSTLQNTRSSVPAPPLLPASMMMMANSVSPTPPLLPPPSRSCSPRVTNSPARHACKQPKLPLSRPPKLNKAILDNVIYSNHSVFFNNSNNSFNANSWVGNELEQQQMTPQHHRCVQYRESPLKMYSLVIERENCSRLADDNRNGNLVYYKPSVTTAIPVYSTPFVMNGHVNNGNGGLGDNKCGDNNGIGLIVSSGGNGNQHRMSVQFNTNNQECFL